MAPTLFPRSRAHLAAARDSEARLVAAWGSLLDAGTIDCMVSTEPDGRGRITVYAGWGRDDRLHLTEEFQRCVGELWACLDSLVVETVTATGALRPGRETITSERFFPVASNVEDLTALLEAGCLDGVLQAQADVVLGCQPFGPLPSDPNAAQLRRGLELLFDWNTRLEQGAQIGAWVTPSLPKLHVTDPVEVVEFHVLTPGELADERDVASYRLVNYSDTRAVSAQAGSLIDLAFPNGFDPVADDDTFDRRLSHVFHTVERFVLVFSALADAVPSIRMSATWQHSDNATWTKAITSPRRWSETELAALRGSDIGVGVVTDTDELTLLVTTADGVFERVIPNASPLSRLAERGVAAEEAIRDAAAIWGLPDFVLKPHIERKGNAVREVSDGMLLVGGRGLSIQVKSRDAASGKPTRERSWLTKKITEAAGQAAGTVRRLSSEPTNMTNGRERSITVDGADVQWVCVVIIDHPDPPTDFVVPELTARLPVVVLLRRDWEFLFNQLRSTYAVVGYLHRVEGSTTHLGEEPTRYYELAAADAAAPPATVGMPKQWGEPRTVPLLPSVPAGHDDDEAHGIVRIMCEDIATSPLDGHSEVDRLGVLAAIDSLPIGYRTELGRYLLDGIEAARSAAPENTFWKFRTFRASGVEVQLGFGVCSQFNRLTRHAFTTWLLLRHHERGEPAALAGLTSIGVLLTPRADGMREWDTSMHAITGDPALTDEELNQYRTLWNNH